MKCFAPLALICAAVAIASFNEMKSFASLGIHHRLNLIVINALISRLKIVLMMYLNAFNVS